MSGEFERVPQMTQVKLKQTEVNIEKNEKAVTLAEYCYLAYFAVMLFARGIGLYEGTTAYTVTLVIGLGLFALKILMTEHTVFEYLWMGLFLLLSLVVYHNTGEKGLLVYMTMMLGIKGVSMKRVFRTGIVFWTIAFVSLFLLTLTGILPEKYFMHDKSGIGYIICHGMGYPHPNVFHIAYLVLAVFIVYQLGYVRGRKLLISVLLLFAGNLYVFAYSVSFTGFFATTVFLFFYTYFMLRGRLNGIEKVLAQLVFPVCVIFSVAGPVLIRGHLYDLINKALNTRYALSNYFLTQQPITLLGTRFTVPNYRYTMDCSYVYAFMQLGIIPFCVICILFILLIHDYVKNDRYVELAIILGFCVAGVTEPFMFNLAYKNMIFLFAGEYLFRRLADFDFVRNSVSGKKVLFLKNGNRTVSVRMLIADRITSFISKVASENGKKRKWYLMIYVLSVLVCAVLFAVFAHKPQIIYINEEVNESRDITPQYFTQDQIEQIVQQGNVVKDYVSSSVPMFAYTGSTVLIEYVREVVSAGLWIGLLIVGLTIMVLYQHGIGEGEKKCRG